MKNVEFDFEIFREFEFGGILSVDDVFPEVLIFFIGDFFEDRLEAGSDDRNTSDIGVHLFSQERRAWFSSFRGLDGASEVKVPLDIIDNFVVDLNFGGNHETVKQFVLFEKAPANINVKTFSNVIDQ